MRLQEMMSFQSYEQLSAKFGQHFGHVASHAECASGYCGKHKVSRAQQLCTATSRTPLGLTEGVAVRRAGWLFSDLEGRPSLIASQAE